MVDCILTVLALVLAWMCSGLFSRPLKRVQDNIENISKGKEINKRKRDYSEVVEVTERFPKDCRQNEYPKQNKTGICI